MTFESDLYAALTTGAGAAALAAWVGESIVPSHEEKPSPPYVVYTPIFDEPRYDLDGETGLTRVRLQVDCYAAHPDVAAAIALAVIAAVPQTGWPLHRTGHSNQDLGLEPGTNLYRRLVELSIFHRS